MLKCKVYGADKELVGITGGSIYHIFMSWSTALDPRYTTLSQSCKPSAFPQGFAEEEEEKQDEEEEEEENFRSMHSVISLSCRFSATAKERENLN